MGAYLLRPHPGERSTFPDRRYRVYCDWNSGVVLLDQTLTERQALSWFVRYLVLAIHYRSGLNDRSNEESFTHSLATGLTELAQGEGAFWPEFNAALSGHLAPRARWGAAAAGAQLPIYRHAPPHVTYRGRECRFSRISERQARRQSGYGFYWVKQGHVQVAEQLQGSNFALVVLHEVIHFLHECEGLTDSTKETPFVRGQTKMLRRFVRENPSFWGWWLSLTAQCRQLVQAA